MTSPGVAASVPYEKESTRRTQRQPRAFPGALVAVLALLATLLHAGRAGATDPFEIQVYDGTANAPGEVGLELHLNTVPVGLGTAPSPEYPLNHQTHFTLEPSLGLFPWWELGGYFQAALRGTDAFDYAGIKLRNKFVTPPSWSEELRLGLNIEFSLLPNTFDRGRWANELRPIVAYENAYVALALNPIIDTSLAGPDASAGPTFEPCFSAAFKVRETVSFGVEYYANLGPFRGFFPWNQQEQYVFEVVNLLSVKHFELNAGVGEGLTDASNRLTFKMILGYVWGNEPPPRPPIPPMFTARR